MYLFIDILSDIVVDYVIRLLLLMYCDVWGRLGDVVWIELIYVYFLMDLYRLLSYCINIVCIFELWKEYCNNIYKFGLFNYYLKV